MRPLPWLLALGLLAAPASFAATGKVPGATVSFEVPSPPVAAPVAAPVAVPAARPTPQPAPKATPKPTTKPAAKPSATPKQVDERPLWKLLQEKRLTELKRTLAALRKSHPSWTPPAQLLSLIQDEETRRAIRNATQSSDPLVVVRWAHRAPRFFDARHLENRWAWLNALKTLERETELRQVLDATLRMPLSDKERLATLQKAQAWLTPEEHTRLIAQERAAARSSQELDELAFIQLGAALQAKDDEAAMRLASPLEAEVRRRRDARWAVSFGWLNFRLGELGKSRAWFEQAVSWSPKDAEAREGLALTLLGLGQTQEAEGVAKGIAATDPRRKRVLSAILAGQGATAYEAQDLNAALDFLTRAEALAPLPPDTAALRGWTLLGLKRPPQAEKVARALPADSPQRPELLTAVLMAQANAAYAAGNHPAALKAVEEAERLGAASNDPKLLKAWIRFQKAEYDAAAEAFADLYDATLDPEAGEGLILSSQKAGRNDLLDARRNDPTLERLRSEKRAREAFTMGRYAKAYAEAPSLFPGLAGVRLPSLTTGISRRSRAGEPGTSDHQVTRAPLLEARLQVTPSDLLLLEVDHLILDNGTLATGSIAGTMPIATPSFIPGYASTVAMGYQPRLHYTHSGSFDLQTTMSLTPDNGPISRRLIGEASLRTQDGGGGVTFGLFSREVSESRLSWIGMADPYAPGSWGGVRRHGLSLGRDFSLSQWMHTGGELQYGLLQGPGVADNDHAAVTWRVRRKWELPYVEEFAGSIGVMGETYRRNLSAFTRGHGGYFSPQLHGKLRLGMEARSADLRPFVVSLRLGVGPSYAMVNATPYFPLAPDGRSHAGYERFGVDYDGELRAATRIADFLHAGVSFATYRNAGYAESYATFFTRLLFGPRRELNSDDLAD